MSLKLRTRRLQGFLNSAHGAKLAVDGKFGPMTMGAVETALGVEERLNPSPKSKVAQFRNFGDAAEPIPRTEFDERTEGNLATLDKKAEPTLRKLVGLAMDVAAENGVVVKVISGNRTWAEQDALYAKGRTRPGKRVTNARGGYSNHNFGIAIDFGVFSPDGKYLDGGTPAQKRLAAKVHQEIADRAKAAGLKTEWGGGWRSFKDYPHHELATGLSIAEKRRRYLRKGSVL